MGDRMDENFLVSETLVSPPHLDIHIMSPPKPVRATAFQATLRSEIRRKASLSLGL